MEATELLIGDETQFFLDNEILEAVTNLKRTIHHPEKIEANPVVQSDRPWEEVGYCLGLARMRRDGYVPLGANRVREGSLTTQPFLSPGSRLQINAACGPDGYIKVEATDVAYQTLPGCGRDDCDVFAGDSVAHEVTWRGSASLPMPDASDMRGGLAYRRLLFILRDAELYSFRIIV